MESSERVRRHRLIDAPPPDLVYELPMPHDELIFRRTASVGAGFDDERPGICQSSFPPTNGVFDEDTRRKVAVIRTRRFPRLSRHRSATCVRSTVGFLNHESDSSLACAHASDPPRGMRG